MIKKHQCGPAGVKGGADLLGLTGAHLVARIAGFGAGRDYGYNLEPGCRGECPKLDERIAFAILMRDLPVRPDLARRIGPRRVVDEDGTIASRIAIRQVEKRS